MEEEKIPDWLIDVWNKMCEIRRLKEKNKDLGSIYFQVCAHNVRGTVELDGYYIRINLASLVDEEDARKKINKILAKYDLQ